MKSATIYQVRIKEQLGAHWGEWFHPLVLQPAPNGDMLLVGPLRDQAELYGLLLKVRNLNLTLLSVTQVEPTSQSP